MHGEPFVADMLAPMPDGPLISYAQNREDVVLWRALGHVLNGRYVEVGANHPLVDSVSRAFYDRGWSGITVEPVEAFATTYRDERPRDRVVQAAITDEPVDTITLHVVPGTGLSTLVDSVSERHDLAGFEHEDMVVPARSLDSVLEESGWTGQEIHFMLVDVEGAEESVLRSVDLHTWRPWVLVVESTLPNSTEPSHESWEPLLVEAGYEFCLFDGLSRFYVAQERADELRTALSYPACPLDQFVPYAVVEARTTASRSLETKDQEMEEVERQLVQWRTRALVQWAEAQAQAQQQPPAPDDSARRELEAIRRTLSWRVTKPLRAVRRLAARKGS